MRSSLVWPSVICGIAGPGVVGGCFIRRAVAHGIALTRDESGSLDSVKAAAR
jgi:hypothetical protein